MRILDYKEEKKKEIMEKCYECYCENGLRDTGIKELGKYCGMTSANLYSYFDNVDDLIVQSTAYCMAKVEDDFMARAPKNPLELFPFIENVAHWTAKKHGKKYRLMYQVYTHPKYIEHGKAFFDGVCRRYTDYARELSSNLDIATDTLVGYIFILVRTVVHYALFEDEYYLKMQLDALKKSLRAVENENRKERIDAV